MCRYVLSGYRSNIVCTHCRIAWKGPRSQWGKSEENGSLKCGRCGRDGVDMGRDFHAPRQTQVNQWKKIESFIARGRGFGGCGCSGPGRAPKTLADEKRQVSGGNSTGLARRKPGTRRYISRA